MRRVYLDHTATTPLDPRVFEAMRPYFLEKFGNASSIHRYGQEARAALDESRAVLARLINARESEVYFTASGTEADNFALKGVARAMRKRGKSHIITSKVEHHAVLETCEFLEEEGFSVTYLDVDGYGRVSPDDIRRVMTPKTGLISIMHANNEVGTINPIEEIAAVAKEHGIVFHTDAVQSFGKIPINVATMGIDLLSLSAHKIYGPKGIGAIVIRKGTEIDKFIHGGGQERGRRASTEAVPLAVGFAKAASLMYETMEQENKRLADLRSHMQKVLEERFPYLIFNRHPVHSLPHILNVSFDSSKVDIEGDVLLLNLDLAGIAATSGSACTSGTMKPSHVLLAMGRDEKSARATIRFSMGRSTSLEDLDYVATVLESVVEKIARVPASTI